MTIVRVLDGKFLHKKDACNCKILCHFTSKMSVIDNRANVFMSIVTKGIPVFMDSNVKKEHTVIKRTFKLLCIQYHLTMISQNFSECKQYLCKRLKNMIEKKDEHMG